LLPLLSLAAAGPVEVRTLGSAVVERRSPALEGALILAASGGAGLPPGPRPPLRLDGARLVVPWAVPDDARLALQSLGAALEPDGEGVAITLPPG
jgi:hypothetical protein